MIDVSPSDFLKLYGGLVRMLQALEQAGPSGLSTRKAGCPIGGTVLDPFMGTGATGEAELSLARNFVGIDISAKFCELTRKRLDKYLYQDRLF